MKGIPQMSLGLPVNTRGRGPQALVRARGNQDLGVMALDDFAQKIVDDIRRKV